MSTDLIISSLFCVIGKGGGSLVTLFSVIDFKTLPESAFDSNFFFLMEYYIDEDEAIFNILIYGALLFLWIIVFAVITSYPFKSS